MGNWLPRWTQPREQIAGLLSEKESLSEKIRAAEEERRRILADKSLLSRRLLEDSTMDSRRMEGDGTTSCKSQRWRPKLEKLAKMDDSERVRVGKFVIGNNEEFLIGTGSDGTEVYLGLADDGTEVAVKKKTIRNLAALKNEETFLRLPKLDDPSIVKYVGFEQDKNFGYLALELCEYNLEEYMRVHKPSDPERKQLAKQVLQSLKVLHCQNPTILHRDIKPQNVFIDAQCRARLADFGISRELQEGHSSIRTSPVGTTSWMAKETLAGHGSVMYKRSSDIQVAGMVIYYILSGGHHPFGAGIKCESNIYEGEYNLHNVQDEAAKDLIEWMINKDPKRRPTVEDCLAHSFFWPDSSGDNDPVCSSIHKGPTSPKDLTAIKFEEAEHCLKTVRPAFIERVSEPTLKRLLDKLLFKKVINDGEYESVSGEKGREAMARVIIDMVRKKGNNASFKMIHIFNELDPKLSVLLHDVYSLVLEKRPQAEEKFQSYVEEEMKQKLEVTKERYEKELEEVQRKKDETIKEIEKNISELEGNISELTVNISEHKGKIFELTGNISVLEYQLTEQKKQRERNEGMKRELEQNIREFKALLTELQKQKERDEGVIRELIQKLIRETERREEMVRKPEMFIEQSENEKRVMAEREIEEMRERYKGQGRMEAERYFMKILLPEIISNFVISDSETKMQREFERQLEAKNREVERQLEAKNRELTTLTEKLVENKGCSVLAKANPPWWWRLFGWCPVSQSDNQKTETIECPLYVSTSGYQDRPESVSIWVSDLPDE